MLKYLSIVSVLIIIAVSASAEIYLRKDGSAKPAAPAVTASSKTRTQPPLTQPAKERAPSHNALDHARTVANACLGGQWESQPCLKAVSENNLTMASNYGTALEQSGKQQEAEFIKQTCAASTAASQEEFPAYAMRSAFVECVNAIPSAANATGILPDQSQFQLLVAAIQCLDKTDACAAIEQSLAQYKN